MMKIGHEEAKRMSWWEFTAVRWQWNERHKTEDSDNEEPDLERMKKRWERLEEKGVARSVH